MKALAQVSGVLRQTDHLPYMGTTHLPVQSEHHLVISVNQPLTRKISTRVTCSFHVRGAGGPLNTVTDMSKHGKTAKCFSE